MGSMNAVRGALEAVTGAATQLLNGFTGDGPPQSLSVDAAVRSIENGGSGCASCKSVLIVPALETCRTPCRNAIT